MKLFRLSVFAAAGLVALAEALVATQSPSPDTPRFVVDPAWPRIPNNWQFGQVASVSIDAQDISCDPKQWLKVYQIADREVHIQVAE